MGVYVNPRLHTCVRRGRRSVSVSFFFFLRLEVIIEIYKYVVDQFYSILLLTIYVFMTGNLKF